MRAWILALAIASTPALALGSPYADWAFRLQRGAEEVDDEGLARTAREAPAFARIWFYGQVFDLLTEGIAEGIKASLRPRLQTIAEVLAASDPPDAAPLLLMDTIAQGGGLAFARGVRGLEEQIIDAVRRHQNLQAQLAPAQAPETAHAVFYRLFYRAELAASRMGGKPEEALLLRSARRMAEGFALAQGDLAPWRTLAAWLSLRAVPAPTGKLVVEAQVGAALNAYLGGDLGAAQGGLEAALKTSAASRGQNLFTAMLRNGVAHSAAWRNDRKTERRLRAQVLVAIRPLSKPTVLGLVLDQMLHAHLAENRLDALLPYSREMRGIGAEVWGRARHLRSFEATLAALKQGADRRVEAGELEGAARLLAEAVAIAGGLAAEEVVALLVPASEVQEARRLRMKSKAQLSHTAGLIAMGRGRFEAARSHFERMRGLFEGPVAETEGVALASTALARAWLAAGRPDEALAHSNAAQAIYAQSADRRSRAQNFEVQARVRLGLGDWTKAFANANHGLEVLRSAGLERRRALRARLHASAAAALEGAGGVAEALERAGWVSELVPTDPHLAEVVAELRARHGDHASALSTLKAARSDEPRTLEVLRTLDDGEES